eukprot:CAMPEP_0197521942 /NCGR_PEP_ID=MMETSP1318-20131121/7153_1 /TAXON_ID=552666 /ORGANISM="Partenskyella glossopodia, Strain RCC365" /LENGTH=487 /DNA_ID=CAMNT_0043074123 /DNA_START=95 /DNA_END=1558 /DNA_ORIENTATION=+
MANQNKHKHKTSNKKGIMIVSGPATPVEIPLRGVISAENPLEQVMEAIAPHHRESVGIPGLVGEPKETHKIEVINGKNGPMIIEEDTTEITSGLPGPFGSLKGPFPVGMSVSGGPFDEMSPFSSSPVPRLAETFENLLMHLFDSAGRRDVAEKISTASLLGKECSEDVEKLCGDHASKHRFSTHKNHHHHRHHHRHNHKHKHNHTDAHTGKIDAADGGAACLVHLHEAHTGKRGALSSGCRSYVMSSPAYNAVLVCSDELLRHCEAHSHALRMKCLKEGQRLSALSPPCSAALKAAVDHHDKSQKTAESGSSDKTAAIPAKSHRAPSALVEKRAKLSEFSGKSKSSGDAAKVGGAREGHIWIAGRAVHSWARKYPRLSIAVLIIVVNIVLCTMGKCVLDSRTNILSSEKEGDQDSNWDDVWQVGGEELAKRVMKIASEDDDEAEVLFEGEAANVVTDPIVISNDETAQDEEARPLQGGGPGVYEVDY